jgi:hypothetical protein
MSRDQGGYLDWSHKFRGDMTEMASWLIKYHSSFIPYEYNFD